jgi:cytochrome c553
LCGQVLSDSALAYYTCVLTLILVELDAAGPVRNGRKISGVPPSKNTRACALLVTSPAPLPRRRGERPGAASRQIASCHGPNGHSAGAIPSIAGLEKTYLIAVLQDFKAGTRPATVMHQHAKGYTDQEFELLADYFSRQKRQ